MPDAHANFASTTVATAPSPATSGTSLVVNAGDGALFPAVPFNATLYAAGTIPTAATAEIVRVTARSTDTLTIVRAQEGTTARTIVAGWVITAGITAKSLTDVEFSNMIPDGNGNPAFLPLTTAPTTPAANLIVFSKKRAGRQILAQVGPSGLDTSLQPFLASNMVAWLRPNGNSTTVSANGLAITAVGTATAANWANSSALASTKRISYVSAATAGASGGLKASNALQFWLGSSAGLGGFYLVWRFGFASIPATRRWFVGMLGSTTSPSNADPSSFVNMVGVGQDVADTTIQFMHNDGTGTATKSNSTLSSPAANEVWEVRVFCKPNGTSFQMSVERVSGTASLAEYDSGVSTDIIANTSGLVPILWANNGTTAAIIDPCLVGCYVETDL